MHYLLNIQFLHDLNYSLQQQLFSFIPSSQQTGYTRKYREYHTQVWRVKLC